MKEVIIDLIEDREYWYCPYCSEEIDWEYFDGECENCGNLVEVDR